MGELGFYNGKIIDLSTPVVTLEDRGHQFGDGVYEAIVTSAGKYFALKEHLDRMERSCAELRLVPGYTRQELENICQLLLQESQLRDAMLYLQWTRGAAPRAHAFPSGIKASFSATIRKKKNPPPESFESGVKVISVPDLRWLRCDIKSLNLLGNLLAKQKAVEAGCFEALLVRDNKFVTEGSSSNSFAVKAGIIFTAPLSNYILPGVTRAIVIELAKALGYEVHEEFGSPEFYSKADEVFLTGTTTEVMPVITLDEKPVGNGSVGPITRKLQQAYSKKANS
jgi:D-alanine transaminase